MNDKNKIIAVNSGKTTILTAATVVDNVLFSGTPLLTTAVSLSLGWYGSAAELRVNRAVEFVYFIKENPGLFVKDLVKTEEFQDAFVYTLERYIRERSEERRNVIKRIFQGYASSSDKTRFEIERMVNLLSLISQKGLELLKILNEISNLEVYKDNNLSDNFTAYLVYNSGKYSLEPGSNIREIWADAEIDLISVGILKSYTLPSDRHKGYSENRYNLTNTGQEFIKYISN